MFEQFESSSSSGVNKLCLFPQINIHEIYIKVEIERHYDRSRMEEAKHMQSIIGILLFQQQGLLNDQKSVIVVMWQYFSF